MQAQINDIYISLAGWRENFFSIETYLSGKNFFLFVRC